MKFSVALLCRPGLKAEAVTEFGSFESTGNEKGLEQERLMVPLHHQKPEGYSVHS